MENIQVNEEKNLSSDAGQVSASRSGAMLQAFPAGPRTFGVIEGPKGFIITEPDFCHSVYRLDEVAELNAGEIFQVQYKPFTLQEIRATARPVNVATFGHYWGIKPRVASNYRELLKSIKEIGVDPSQMPTWGERTSEVS